MLLFQKRFHAGLVAGSVTLTFRRWPRPRVKVGGRYRVHPIGVVQVDARQPVKVGEITEDDARNSGFASRSELLDYMRPIFPEGLSDANEVYRVQLRHGGDGDRVEAALNDSLSPEDVEALRQRLKRFDAAGPKPWTAKTLQIIGERPRVAASQLAKQLKRETLPFKIDVRKLKKLGLTQSFEVGYEISPRGRAYLEATRANRGGARAGSASPSAKRPRKTGSSSPARGKRAGGAPAARTSRRSGKSGAASRGKR
jgi:hypothetical protein